MSKTLIVIDVQMAFVEDRDAGYPWANPEADARIGDLIGAFRAAGLPVIHVHHCEMIEGSEFHPDATGYKPQPCATPLTGEAVFVKERSSAFAGTGLEPHLRVAGLSDLVIAGGAANFCVESTTRAASDMGFRVTLAEDALLNHQKTQRDGRVAPPQEVLAMTLANLGGQFAEVLKTSDIVAMVNPSSPPR
jgi:nicotinamidase-related amidase